MVNTLVELYQQHLDLDPIDFIVSLTIIILAFLLFKDVRKRFTEMEKIKVEKKREVLEYLYQLNLELSKTHEEISFKEVEKIIPKILVYVSDSLGDELIKLRTTNTEKDMQSIQELVKSELIGIKKTATLENQINQSERSLNDHFMRSVNLWFMPIFVPASVTLLLIAVGMFFTIIVLYLYLEDSFFMKIKILGLFISYIINCVLVVHLISLMNSGQLFRGKKFKDKVLNLLIFSAIILSIIFIIVFYPNFSYFGAIFFLVAVYIINKDKKLKI